MDYFAQLDAAEIAVDTFARIDEGEYKAVIEECKAVEANGKMKLTAKMRITSELFTNRIVFWNTTMSKDTTPANMSIIKRSICTMAGVGSTNGDPMATFKSSEGNTLEIKIAYKPNKQKPGSEFMQVYPQKVIIPF